MAPPSIGRSVCFWIQCSSRGRMFTVENPESHIEHRTSFLCLQGLGSLWTPHPRLCSQGAEERRLPVTSHQTTSPCPRDWHSKGCSGSGHLLAGSVLGPRTHPAGLSAPRELPPAATPFMSKKCSSFSITQAASITSNLPKEFVCLLVMCITQTFTIYWFLSLP